VADFPQKLVEIAHQLEKGEKPERATVRNFLEWFGAQRRGYYVVQNIRNLLRPLHIRTEPDFESAYIDGLIEFVSDSLQPARPAAASFPAAEASPSSSPVSVETAKVDPTQRIGRLESANKAPLTVKADAPLVEAVTKMLGNDFSQLPIMQNERDVKGIISWTSIGSRMALGCSCKYVNDCMESHHEISSETSLFAAIDSIIKHQYVLIRSTDRRISGIVTTSDLSLQFLQLGEPFLLVGEIENHIRSLIDGRFSTSELEAAAKDPSDPMRKIAAVSDLAFGEYVRLLQNPDRWAKLELPIDRALFIEQLERVRLIRNDVMHFDPDGPAPRDLETLRNFVRFLEQLQTIRRP
jgi:hypothetical protein